MMTKVNHFLMFRFGVSSVFVTGCVGLCVSTLLFSLLSLIEDVTLFLTLAYILRVVEGVAGAILWPAMLAPILRRYRWTLTRPIVDHLLYKVFLKTPGWFIQ